MPKRDDVVLLRDIQDAINQIESYLAGVSFGVFCETPLLQDGVMHRLEIIGEVSRNLSDAFLEQYPDIPWQDIIGMRNRLAHAYFAVDLRRSGKQRKLTSQRSGMDRGYPGTVTVGILMSETDNSSAKHRLGTLPIQRGFSYSSPCSPRLRPSSGWMWTRHSACPRPSAAGWGGSATPGAVTGALMTLGLKYGAAVADPAAKERMYAETREFIARFQARHGAPAWDALLG